MHLLCIYIVNKLWINNTGKFLCNLFNPNLGHERVTEVRSSQELSDVATMVRVGCNWALNVKLLRIRNIVIVI